MVEAIKLFTTILIVLVIAIIFFSSSVTPADAPAYCTGLNTSTGSNPKTFRPNDARLFPFCVGKDPETGKWSQELFKSGFTYLIDTINDQKLSKRDMIYVHLVPEGAHQKGQLKVAMEPHFVSGNGKKLNYWLAFDTFGLYVRKNSKGKPYPAKMVQGLYIQAIQGPLGIPFGEFLNLNPTKPNPDPAIPESGQYLSYKLIQQSLFHRCTFYSKAGPRIPNVLILSSKRTGSGYQGLVKDGTYYRFKFTFRWEDDPCSEVAFFQFLIVIVYEWPKGAQIPPHRVALSQVFLPGRLKFDPSNGKPSDCSGCTLTTSLIKGKGSVSYDQNDSKDWKQYRIVSNLDYEHCVVHKVGLVRKGDDKGACPPGPFRCDKTNRPTDADKVKERKENIWTDWREIYRQYEAKIGRAGCDPPPPPTTTTTTTKPTTPTTATTTKPTTTTTTTTTKLTTTTTALTTIPTTTITQEPEPPTTTIKPRNLTDVEKLTNKVAKVAVKVESLKVISHGDLCVFIWFVLVPISNYFVRFFKDFPNWETFGVGFWIVGHIVIHHVCVLLMWISFGLVVSNGSTFLGGADLLHYVYGFPATFIQHYELFNAFFRERREQSAQRQSFTHVIVGYASSLLSLSCALKSHIEGVRWYLLICLFAINIAGIIAGTILEKKVEKRLGVFPPRRMVPMLQRIMMVNAKPRLYKSKIIVTCVYILALVALFSLFFLYEDYFH